MDKEEVQTSVKLNTSDNLNSSSTGSFMSRRASFDFKNHNNGQYTNLEDSLAKFNQSNQSEYLTNSSKTKTNNTFFNSPTFMTRRSTYANIKSPPGDNACDLNKRPNFELNKNVYSSFKTSGLIGYAQNDKRKADMQIIKNVNIIYF